MTSQILWLPAAKVDLKICFDFRRISNWVGTSCLFLHSFIHSVAPATVDTRQVHPPPSTQSQGSALLCHQKPQGGISSQNPGRETLVHWALSSWYKRTNETNDGGGGGGPFWSSVSAVTGAQILQLNNSESQQLWLQIYFINIYFLGCCRVVLLAIWF